MFLSTSQDLHNLAIRRAPRGDKQYYGCYDTAKNQSIKDGSIKQRHVSINRRDYEAQYRQAQQELARYQLRELVHTHRLHAPPVESPRPQTGTSKA